MSLQAATTLAVSNPTKAADINVEEGLVSELAHDFELESFIGQIPSCELVSGVDFRPDTEPEAMRPIVAGHAIHSRESRVRLRAPCSPRQPY